MVHLHALDDLPTLPLSRDIADDLRWAAVIARDTSITGPFVVAVASTGTYCRVDCTAPRPPRRSVRYFPTVDAARRLGYVACLRCHPDHAPELRAS